MSMKKTILVTALAVLLTAGMAGAQVDFSNYVALGDSLTAGYASSGLVQFYQERSYPALLATQAGAPAFEMPLVSAPGLPNLLELQSLSPLTLAPIPGAPGLPINAEYPLPYNNLGVPGSAVFDTLFTVGDITNLLAGNQNNVMHDLILRIPVVLDPDTGLPVLDPITGEPIPFPAVTQAIARNPTFVSVWIGNNDILAAALAGTPIEGVTMTPVEDFQALYTQLIGALATMTTADMVLLNLPDATAIPYVTTVDPFVDIPGVGRIYLISDQGQLTDSDMVTLGAAGLIAQGYGLPGGPPLPADLNPLTGEPGYVLSAAERQVISERIAAFNAVIDGVAAEFGIPVLDVNQIFGDIAAGDRWILGGIELSADFLTGGIFSYDGVHPQTIGYGLVAVNLIDLINDSYNANIPQVNMEQILCTDGCSGMGVPIGSDPKSAVLTPEANRQLLDLFTSGTFGFPRDRSSRDGGPATR
jgi:lysophospholipase L1-like esterase